MEKKKKTYRRWTRQMIIEEVRSFPDYSAKNIQRVRPELYGAAVRHFGSWKKAIEASGLDYQRVRRKRPFGFWTEHAVTEKIVSLEHKHSAFVRKKHADLYSAALRIFGSWEKAVRASGLSYEQVRKGSKKL